MAVMAFRSGSMPCPCMLSSRLAERRCSQAFSWRPVRFCRTYFQSFSSSGPLPVTGDGPPAAVSPSGERCGPSSSSAVSRSASISPGLCMSISPFTLTRSVARATVKASSTSMRPRSLRMSLLRNDHEMSRRRASSPSRRCGPVASSCLKETEDSHWRLQVGKSVKLRPAFARVATMDSSSTPPMKMSTSSECSSGPSSVFSPVS
mmetsp:Transcript_8875/g.25573  ORF Transcript_8875/g.25573 Transcript_8875/m.25573 type:complete len:205 (-) Transcript_8875:1522-2136(-)